MDFVTITISSENAIDLEKAKRDAQKMIRILSKRSEMSNRKFGHVVKLENTKTGKVKKILSRSF